MNTITELLTTVLVLLSLFLIVSIPVAMAGRTEWEQSSGKYIKLSQLWLTLVGATGLVSSLGH
jgi:photosystem II core protein PsbZ